MMLDAELMTGHHALIGGFGRGPYVRSLVLTALVSGVRVIVLDNGRNWDHFAASFDGLVYFGRGDHLHDAPRAEEGKCINLQSRVQAATGPVVIDLEQADAQPGANFSSLIQALAIPARRPLVVLDQPSFNQQHDKYVGRLLNRLGEFGLLVSCASDGDAEWVSKHAPDLSLLRLYGADRAKPVATAEQQSPMASNQRTHRTAQEHIG